LTRLGLFAAVFAGIIADPAVAGERKLAGADIHAVLADQTLWQQDTTRNVSQTFLANGTTHYVENGHQSRGFWRTEGDKYCSQWPPSEHWSCYDVLLDGGVVIFVSSGGERSRFVVRPPH
jgi:hypothetical protein